MEVVDLARCVIFPAGQLEQGPKILSAAAMSADVILLLMRQPLSIACECVFVLG